MNNGKFSNSGQRTLFWRWANCRGFSDASFVSCGSLRLKLGDFMNAFYKKEGKDLTFKTEVIEIERNNIMGTPTDFPEDDDWYWNSKEFDESKDALDAALKENLELKEENAIHEKRLEWFRHAYDFACQNCSEAQSARIKYKEALEKIRDSSCCNVCACLSCYAKEILEKR